MSICEQVKQMKKIQSNILKFIDKEGDSEELFQNIIQQIEDRNISTKRHEMKTILYLLSKILNNHYRYPNFISKIERILQKYKREITNNFTSYEIYKIFEKNRRILLFLFKEEIIKMNANFSIEISDENFVYLFPKVAAEKKLIEKVPDDFESKQEIGENEEIICEIIRKDLIEEFIIYVNKNDYALNNTINKSIFETNDFLIKHKDTTLIEYAAFFGSTQIFKYLYKNGVELTPSLWIYGIHSDNPEMIHLLEENEIQPPNESYEECIKESIKCHHNDVTNYIQSNLINKDIQNIDDIDYTKNYKTNIYSYCFHYYNFSYFPEEMKNKIIFYYACQYDYFEIVKYFLNEFKIDIMAKIVFFYIIFIKFEMLIFNDILQNFHYSPIRNAAKNDNQEILNLLMSQKQFRIEVECFKECKKLKHITIPSSVYSFGDYAFIECSSLKQISIPSSLTSIGEGAFAGCSSLTQISIPSSVITIGDFVFSGCSSLTQITIPSAVASIRVYSFYQCSSLTQITIPPSVKSIGNDAFAGCSSLTQISIPSFVSEIGNCAFEGCSSLKQISIPSSVKSISCYTFSGCSSLTQISFETPSSIKSIKDYAFLGCSSLTQITIPSSVKSIGDDAFRECTSLTQISIPSNVTKIGEGAFNRCSSLTQIAIPSSVTSIGDYAFFGCSSLTQISILSSITKIGKCTFKICSSLTQISIPSSVNKIGNEAFSECSKLTQISIPSSVTSIGKNAFSRCSSLTQISIPSSVTSIGYNAFRECSSLTQISIPSSVTKIGSYVFYGCSSLAQISIPSNLNTLNLGINSGVKINMI